MGTGGEGRKVLHPEFLRAMLDAAPDLIYAKDLDGAYLACNQASEKLVGLTEAEQVGKSDRDFFSAEFAASLRAEDLAVLTSGREHRFEEWVTYPDGTRALMESIKSPFFGQDGKVAGLVGVSRDITARRRAEEERERTLAELTRALANVKALRGLLPLCAWCKKIRDDQGYWQQLEAYLLEHSGARISHGMCPECQEKHFP